MRGGSGMNLSFTQSTAHRDFQPLKHQAFGHFLSLMLFFTESSKVLQFDLWLAFWVYCSNWKGAQTKLTLKRLFLKLESFKTKNNMPGRKLGSSIIGLEIHNELKLLDVS